MKRRDPERWLRRHGANRERSGAKHDIWHREGVEAAIRREINTHTARAICEQLGRTGAARPMMRRGADRNRTGGLVEYELEPKLLAWIERQAAAAVALSLT
jgi:hypothetical protein